MNDSILKLYPLKDACVYLNMSHEYCRKLAREGKIPARKVRGKFLMSVDDVKAAILGNL